MKKTAHNTHQKYWFSAAISFALFFMAAAPRSAFAQTNTFPSSGNVGIGTTSPTQALDVNGQVVTTGSQTLTVANKGVIEVTNTITNNAVSVSALRARNTFNGNGNGPLGLDLVPTFAPSANINLARGMVVGGFFAPPSGVTISNVYGANAVTAYLDVSGAVTNGTTLQISQPIVFGALKPTTQYGLYVLNQGISGTTNSYGLYVDAQSGSTNNYAAIFAGGNVGIGTTTPGRPLEIADGNPGLRTQLRLYHTEGDAGVNPGSTEIEFLHSGNQLATSKMRVVRTFNQMGSSNTDFSLDLVKGNAGDNGNTTNTVLFAQGLTGNLGIGTTTPEPGSKLDVNGAVRSRSGGFKFPDGTVQTTAATMTGVSAGAGLTGGVSNGIATVDVGQGTGVTVAADSISVNYGSINGTAVQGSTTITVGTASTDGLSGGGQFILGAGGTLNLVNTDKGSSQAIFKHIGNVTGAPQLSATTNDDTISFAGSGGTSVTFDTQGSIKKVIIDSSGITSSQWANGSGSGSINYASGKVGIGTNDPSEKLEINGNLKLTGTGNITAAGTIEGYNIKARFQDVAEWVPSSERILAGTVVVLDTTKSNQVISSSQAYDTRVAGVVSEQPGLVLGESGQGKVLVATTGRVLVKVDATNDPIHIGDLLVTSDVPGLAMKSEPITIGTRKIHTPGTLIGKALEPLEKGSGKILVLLSLQ